MKLLKDKIITAWLEGHNVEQYSIEKSAEYGYVVNVEGDVDLSKRKLKSIPVKFGEVKGNFDVSYNSLTSLEGSPDCILADFICNYNNLSTLEFGPWHAGSYYCGHNKLISLEGCATQIGRDFYCNNNLLTTLEHCPERVHWMFGEFDCSHNKLTTLQYRPSTAAVFNCEGNLFLGKLQDMKKIEDIDIHMERFLLGQRVRGANKSQVHKL